MTSLVVSEFITPITDHDAAELLAGPERDRWRTRLRCKMLFDRIALNVTLNTS